MAQKLEQGMIVFAPAGLEGPRPKVWTVKSAGKRSATLIAHHDTCHETATLRTGELPKGWRVVSNEALAHDLQRHHAA